MTKHTQNGPRSLTGIKINVTKLPSRGMPVEIEPDVEDRAQIALENGLTSVDFFRADLKLTRWQRDGVRVAGRLNARITQPCSISLEPVEQTIDAQVDALFVPETSKLAKRQGDEQERELLIDPEGDDAPEQFDLPYLDVGAVAQEFFALAIDPYPRAPGYEESLSVDTDPNPETDEKPNPFAGLASLKDKL